MDRSYSLRGGSDFQRVWENGKSWSSTVLVLRVHANGTNENRFGFVVGKKVGKAVQRNRTKRLMREAVRRRLDRMRHGWDIILIARREAEDAEFAVVDTAVENLFQRARLFRELEER